MTTQMVQPPLNNSGMGPAEVPQINDRPELSHKEAAFLARFAHEHYEKMKNARVMIERQWYLNMAFYYGRQNVVMTRYNTIGNRLIVPPAPPWRVRPVINRIRPIIRTELAKLTSQKPSATVVPASSEDADLFAAQAGEQIWESLYHSKKLKDVIRRAIWWTVITGTGYVKSYWDKYKIDPVSGQPGDICFEPETPFHILVPDLREESLENQPYLIHSSTRSLDYIHMHYKETLDGREVRPNARSSNDILDDAFLNLVGVNQMDYNSVLLHEVWIKPGCHPKFPHGAVFTTTEDQVLQFYPAYPYDHKEFPLSKFDHVPTGKYYAESVIVDLIYPQREYNRTRGQIVEAKNRMAKPQLTAQIGSVDVSKMTSEPGQVIEYKPGFQPPQPLPLQSIPQYVINEIAQIQQDMDDISGQHEVTRGSVPPGVTAATAISFLQEQDDSKLSHTIDSIETGVEKMAKHSLSYVVQYWDIPRLVKVTGTDGSWDAIMLKGSQLNGNTDIRVEAGSALPTSKAAKQALVMDLMKLGFVKPEEGLAIMEMGGITSLYESVQIDQAQARRENLKMQNLDAGTIREAMAPPTDPMTGQPVPPEVNPRTGQPKLPEPAIPVNNWDNHAIHIDTHNRFRKSQQFEQLPLENKMLFELHVQKHMEAIAAPHIGGMPTPEMMIGIAEQQRNQPPPTDYLTPMDAATGENPEEMMAPGPEAAPPVEEELPTEA